MSVPPIVDLVSVTLLRPLGTIVLYHIYTELQVGILHKHTRREPIVFVHIDDALGQPLHEHMFAHARDEDAFAPSKFCLDIDHSIIHNERQNAQHSRQLVNINNLAIIGTDQTALFAIDICQFLDDFVCVFHRLEILDGQLVNIDNILGDFHNS